MQIIGGPVIIEDVSLCFNSLKGLPGPYIKSFVEKLGRQGLCNILNGFEDRSAYAMCIYVYCHSSTSKPQLFKGICHGQILKSPRGESKFGWDPIFQPDGYKQTFAEMDPELKNEFSHRALALKELSVFLN